MSTWSNKSLFISIIFMLSQLKSSVSSLVLDISTVQFPLQALIQIQKRNKIKIRFIAIIFEPKLSRILKRMPRKWRKWSKVCMNAPAETVLTECSLGVLDWVESAKNHVLIVQYESLIQKLTEFITISYNQWALDSIWF